MSVGKDIKDRLMDYSSIKENTKQSRGKTDVGNMLSESQFITIEDRMHLLHCYVDALLGTLRH